MVIVVLGLAFLFTLYVQRENVLNSQLEENFESDAKEIIATIISNKKIREESLLGIDQFFSSSLNVNKWEFKNYTFKTLQKLNLFAICYFGSDKREYSSENNSKKPCSSYANSDEKFDTTTSNIILRRSVRSADGTKGYALMIFSFESLLPSDLNRDRGVPTNVNLDAGNSQGYGGYFYRSKLPFVSDGITDYFLTVSRPKLTSIISFSTDYILVLVLYVALLVLTIYTVETGLRREKFISLKVRRQERAIKNQYDELVKQRKIASQNERLASIGILAAGIGHEINNPLTIILGHLHSLKRKLLASHINEIKDKVHKVEEAAIRIEKIVSGLRKFSRQSKEEVIDKFYVKEVFCDTVSMLKDLYEKEGISINLNMEVGENTIISGDKGKFQQIIINLVSNARDAVTGRSNGRVNIIVRQHRGLVDISVKDNGIGMNEDQKENIFDLFYTTKDVGKGTGIGLSLVHGFVKDDFKGNIFVESKPERGSIFKIVLPVQQGFIKREIKEVNMEIDQVLNCNVLVVDDEEGIRDLLKEILEDHGVVVSVADSGESALEYLLNNPGQIDVIVSDMKMPKMDGPTLLKEVRQNTKLSQSKFILVTGGVAFDFDNHSELGQEVDGFIYKPFSEEEIVEKIASVLPKDGRQHQSAA